MASEPMDLTAYTSTEIPIFCRGYNDALAGVPFDPHGPDVWQEGHRYGVILLASKAALPQRPRLSVVPQ